MKTNPKTFDSLPDNTKLEFLRRLLNKSPHLFKTKISPSGHVTYHIRCYNVEYIPTPSHSAKSQPKLSEKAIRTLKKLLHILST